MSSVVRFAMSQIAISGVNEVSSLDRMLGLLSLFDDKRPVWTVEQAVESTNYSRSTVYRYFKSLCGIGLLDPISGGGYTLGPGIIALDRRVRTQDPLLSLAQPIAAGLMRQSGESVLLYRTYGDNAICLHHEQAPHDRSEESRRGVTSPIYLGASGKVMLSRTPTRRLRSLHRRNQRQLAEAGLGQDWGEFRNRLLSIRRSGHFVSHGELRPGRVCVATPVSDAQQRVVASLALCMPAERFREDRLAAYLGPLQEAAEQIVGGLDRQMSGIGLSKSA